MKNTILWYCILVLVLCATTLNGAESFRKFEQIPYLKQLYEVAQKPVVKMRLRLGNKEDEVGNAKPVADHGKHPRDFFPLVDGSIWVLDNYNFSLKHFSALGKLDKTISLRPWMNDETSAIADFVVVPEIGIFMLTSPIDTDSQVVHLNEQGVELRSWPAARGNFLHYDPGRKLLFLVTGGFYCVGQKEGVEVYDLAGKEVMRVTGNGLSGVISGSGEVMGIRVQERDVAEFFRVTGGGEMTVIATYSLDLPQEEMSSGYEFCSEAGIIGRDAAGAIYAYLLVTSIPDGDRVYTSKLLKLSESGAVLGQTDIFFPVTDFFYEETDFFRAFYITQPDVLLAFDVRGKYYRILEYKIR